MNYMINMYWFILQDNGRRARDVGIDTTKKLPITFTYIQILRPRDFYFSIIIGIFLHR